MKKFVSLVLAIAVLASFGVIFASAEKKATISASGTEAVYADGDFVRGSFYLTVDDPDNGGKDWVGIYPVSKTDENITESAGCKICYGRRFYLYKA